MNLTTVTKIHGIKTEHQQSEKNIEIEITQGDKTNCSPLYSMSNWEDELGMDWESGLSIVPDVPIQFVIRIKEQPLEQPGLLRRSKTTRQAIRGTMGRMLNLKSSHMDIDSLNSNKSMKPTDSCASFNSISSISSSINQKQKTTVGNFNICSPAEWVSKFSNRVESHPLSLFSSDWDHKKRSILPPNTAHDSTAAKKVIRFSDRLFGHRRVCGCLVWAGYVGV